MMASDYEKLLTESNIKRSIRYFTQCIEGLQFEQAMINLATEEYAGKPLSNSLLIGAITIDEEFRNRGYDFSSEELEKDSSKRDEIRNKKIDLWKKIRGPNIIALRKQFSYLSSVARDRGLDLHPGAILVYTPFSPISEVKEAREKDQNLRFEGESEASKDFVIGLLKKEQEYIKIFSEIFKNKEGDSNNYLFENFSEELNLRNY